MGRLDDLVAEVKDPALRRELRAALVEIKRQQRFGLVFEEHIPETTALLGLPIQVDSLVQKRDTEGNGLRRVVALAKNGKLATVSPLEGGKREVLSVKALMSVKRFGDPIYPTLRSLGSVTRGGDKPFHAVIDGENYHALQLLIYLFEREVDCIYIDPPYNTGARDWKYNNNFVDRNDRWRHSKWLSMMEKRLQLAKRLLKQDGVLIVTVDENEVHHLGMLLEHLFPQARRQMVTICIQPSGASGEGLSRVEEYAIFCFFGTAEPVRTPDDMLIAASNPQGDEQVTLDEGLIWESLLRRGNAWYRSRRKNLCYPILLTDDATRIVRAGPPFEGEDEEARPSEIDGHPVAWPVRKDGKLGIWRVDGARLNYLAGLGYAHVAGRDDVRKTWALRYLMSGTVSAIEDGSIEVTGRGDRGEVIGKVIGGRSKIAKTMWYRGRHNAGGAGGTQILNALLGKRNVFSFPKSVYAVRDCLQVAIGDRPNALILDFFAGSGTTLHATAMLNAPDNGRRQCILVTNNEVEAELAAKLHKRGMYRGDPEYEKNGVFEMVTRPRVEAAITGHRPDGSVVQGEYIDGRTYSQGFHENVEFFRLDYLDPNEVDLGKQFDSIFPSLWLSAGGKGKRDLPKTRTGFFMPESSAYAILFNEAKFQKFWEALKNRPEVTHAWLVTDSGEAYAEMRSDLPKSVKTSMLYHDYLRNFEINRQ